MPAQIPGPVEQRVRIEPLPPVTQVMGQGVLPPAHDSPILVQVKGREEKRGWVTPLAPTTAEVVQQRWFITNVPIGFPVPSRVENAVGVTPLPPTRFQVVSERVGVLRMYVRVTRTVKGRVEKAAFVDDPVG